LNAAHPFRKGMAERNASLFARFRCRPATTSIGELRLRGSSTLKWVNLLCADYQSARRIPSCPTGL
jgi:hypothetical protein